MSIMVRLGIACILSLTTTSTADGEVPPLINYQGRLTDSEGAVVPDGNYSVTFRVYDDTTTPDHLWAEGQLVTVEDGLFAVILGSLTAFPENLFDGPDRWLGLQVESEPEMMPRARLTSVPYALVASRSAVAESVPDNSVTGAKVADGTLEFVDMGQNGAEIGECLKWDGSSWIADMAAGSNWSVANSVLSTNSLWGLSRGGAGNTAIGTEAHTSVNFGISSITGIEGEDNAYATIGGGYNNRVSRTYGTVSGGSTNEAGYEGATVGGGLGNFAKWTATTVSGGQSNSAHFGHSTVGGGRDNMAQGYWSTVAGGHTNIAYWTGGFVGGGYHNICQGEHSSIVGGYQNRIHGGNYSTIVGDSANYLGQFAHHSVLFGISSSLTEDSTFMVDLPHIRFGDETDGYEFPAEDGSSGRVMVTDGNGLLGWSAQPGIAYAMRDDVFSVIHDHDQGTFVNALSVTGDFPGDGFVTILVTADMLTSGYIALSDTPDGDTYYQIYQDDAGIPISMSQVVPVSQGEYSFYVNVASVSSSNTVQATGIRLIVSYYPVDYSQ